MSRNRRSFRSIHSLAVASLGALLAFGCHGDRSPTAVAHDPIPPAPIGDLTITRSSQTPGDTLTTVALAWTAVGDDSLTGQAARYELRVHDRPIVSANWDSASIVPGLPAPSPAGHRDTVTVRLDQSQEIYLAIRAEDHASNLSPLAGNVHLSGYPYLPQTSIHNCLYNFVRAYTRRNLARYSKCLADSFTFVFSLMDVQDGNVPFASWRLAGERQSTGNMFSSKSVEGIELNWVPGDSASADSLFPSPVPGYPPTWKVVISQVYLRVDTRTVDGGQLTLLVPGGFEAFYFCEGPDQDHGLPIWRIFRWEDEPVEPDRRAAEKSSWGLIKNYYFSHD